MEKRVMTDSKRRRGLLAASAMLGGVLVLSACSSGDGSKASASDGETSQAQADAAAAKKSSQAQIKITPADGSDNASINNAAAVTVSKGTLTAVTMTTESGTPVSGQISADKKSPAPRGAQEPPAQHRHDRQGDDEGGQQGDRG
ncbi:Ig-like domain-containing protein, partial [Micrococcus luteus]